MGFDRRAQLAQLTMPALLIAGSDDRNAPPAVMRGMAERMPDVRYVEFERCGHLMMFEQPDAFNAALIGFLQSLAASTRN